MNYLDIANHYKKCFQKHGDSHLGVDWPNYKDTLTRHEVMISLLKDEKSTLLDFGCGLGHFYEYIKFKNNSIKYYGLDINPEFIDFCTQKYPHLKNQYICCDIHKTTENLPTVDYIVANGVFTEKLNLTENQMKDYFYETIKILWDYCNKGMAFNIMSKCVDWERDDLFHLSMDELGIFLKENLSNEFVFRYDYGLYEYTAYVYK